MNLKSIFIVVCMLISFNLLANDILVEAESFNHTGGWVIDTQAYTSLGSAYLMAHGMGKPVEDAYTHIDIERKGKYRIWVRTRDWVKTWDKDGSPGRFQLLVDGEPLSAVFGTEQAQWHWQDGGIVTLKKGQLKLALKDLTGFNGRCDAIVLTRDLRKVLPNDKAALKEFRKKNTPLAQAQQHAGTYDLVVVGGGMAGITTAITAARLGSKVALIQNRALLGGNNSSEVRVGLSGLVMQEPYSNLGNLIDEIGHVGYWNNKELQWNPGSERSKQIEAILKKNPEKLQHNAGPTSNYRDDKKLNAVLAEKNISLFLHTEAVDVVVDNCQIQSVIAKNVITGQELKFDGKLFSDCTGDGVIGYLAGAAYRIGRVSRAETGEMFAPAIADSLVMGSSVQWYAEDIDNSSDFPACPWAMEFDENNCFYLTRGDWDWETGIGMDQIGEIEYIRDLSLRAVYGNWDYIKNRSAKKDSYKNTALQWVAYVAGKRESRRLIGDFVLKEQDILNNISYEDASFTTTWPIDLHYPKSIKGMETKDPFIAYCEQHKIQPYAVPYRCLYSSNINNLFMAGRNISVTHVALGTVRVQRTTGMMGEVVGMAASICLKNNVLPRDVYRFHLDDLKALMAVGVGVQGFSLDD